MRILHISTRLILGGSQENTVLSCEGQSRRGHEVHLAFGPIYGPEGSMLARVEAFNRDSQRPITTHIVPNLVREVSPLRDRRALRELGELIEGLRPDVVHTHSSKAGILGRLAAHKKRDREGALGGGGHAQSKRTHAPTLAPIREGGPAIIHTIHGPPFMPVEGGAIRRLKTRALNAAYTLAERAAAERCDIIVSVADAMTREFLRRGIGRPGQYVTVRSGIEVGPYLHAAPGEGRAEVRAALGLATGDFVIGTVSRLAEHKGHDDLLDALGGDLRANPHWKLLWVGDGWLRDRLVGRARALELSIGAPRSGSPTQIIITGLVEPARVPGLIRAMDVLAHPSYREGLPRTVPQALLCGVCPVAYAADGTGEVCREMETGRLVAVGDRAGLRAAVAWCAANPGEARALAARGQEECRREFSAERMVDELERVYVTGIDSFARPE